MQDAEALGGAGERDIELRRAAWAVNVTAVATMAFGLLPVRAVPPGRGSRGQGVEPATRVGHVIHTERRTARI